MSDAIQYQTHFFVLDKFSTSSGKIFKEAPVSYTQYGKFEGKKKRALFFHAFSSDSRLHIWWEKFNFRDLLKHYDILSIDSLGSCHGSLGPTCIDFSTKEIYGATFPHISIQDTIDFIVNAIDKIQIKDFDVVFGCSLGGMQALDMFLRFPTYSKRFISVCGTPLPLMTRLLNVAQCNIITDAINQPLNEDELKVRMGLARFFFRLSSATENGLRILGEENFLKKPLSTLERLESYFINDSVQYKKIFSPYSYNLYMRMLANFELGDCRNLMENNSSLLLVDIQNDIFVREEDIRETFYFLKEHHMNVEKETFKTEFGHESWIIDGERFYDFIKKNFFN